MGSVKTARSRMLVMIYRLNEREEEVLSTSCCGVFSGREGLSISGILSELIILRNHRLTTLLSMQC